MCIVESDAGSICFSLRLPCRFSGYLDGGKFVSVYDYITNRRHIAKRTIINRDA